VSDSSATGETSDGQERELPEPYRAAEDDGLSESAGAAVTPETKRFLEDYADVHPDHTRVAEIIRAQVNELKDRKGSEVHDLKERLEEQRRDI